MAHVFDDIIVATDHKSVAFMAGKEGIKATMTGDHSNGSERVFAVASDLGLSASDVVVNVQADEPCLMAADLAALCRHMALRPRCQCATLAHRLPLIQSDDRNRVKVAVDLDKRALYFSRALIPSGDDSFLIHIGVYAYHYATLQLMQELSPTPNEIGENLEQLRLLDNGIGVDILKTQSSYHAVDVPGDVGKVEVILLSRQ